MHSRIYIVNAEKAFIRSQCLVISIGIKMEIVMMRHALVVIAFVSAIATVDGLFGLNAVNIPYSSIDFPYNNAYINTAIPTIIGTLFDDNRQVVTGQTVHIFINDMQIGSSVSDDRGIFRFVITDGFADGSYSLRVLCFESQVYLGPIQFVVDTTLPLTVILYPEDGSTVTTNAFTVYGTTETNAMVTIFLDDDTYGENCYADESGHWTNDCFLANGSHAIVAQAIDIAGNQGPTCAQQMFLVFQ